MDNRLFRPAAHEFSNASSSSVTQRLYGISDVEDKIDDKIDDNGQDLQQEIISLQEIYLWQQQANRFAALCEQHLPSYQQDTLQLRLLSQMLQERRSIYGLRSSQLQDGFKFLDRAAKTLYKRAQIDLIEPHFISELTQRLETLRNMKKPLEEQARTNYIKADEELYIVQNHFYLKNTGISLYVYQGETREIVKACHLPSPCAVGVVLTKLHDEGITEFSLDKEKLVIHKDKPYSQDAKKTEFAVSRFIGNDPQMGLPGRNFRTLPEKLKQLDPERSYSLAMPRDISEWEDMIQRSNGKGIIAGIATTSERGERIGHAVLIDTLFERNGAKYVNIRDPMGISYAMSLNNFMRLHVAAAILPY